MNCNNELIHAYLDGELAPADRAAVESHLAGCVPCRELLADLRRLSQLVAAAPMVDMPPHAMTRMQQAWWAARAAQDRGVLRIASWLTAAAAAVIFAAVMFSPPDRVETNSNFSVVALMQPPAEFQEPAEPPDELLIATQWIADDLSLAERQP